MGLTRDQLRASMDALAAIEPGFAAALARVGYPEPRIRPRGYETLLRTIVGQQVSVKAAAAAQAGILDDQRRCGAREACLEKLSRNPTGARLAHVDSQSRIGIGNGPQVDVFGGVGPRMRGDER